MTRIGTLRIVAHEKAGWYRARGWQEFDLGPYHGTFSVGFFRPWRKP